MGFKKDGKAVSLGVVKVSETAVPKETSEQKPKEAKPQESK